MHKKYMLDLHTHTTASGHAYSTLSENVKYADEIGLSLLGISDHAPAMPYSTNDFYFFNSGVIPRQFGNLRLLFGVELNILDVNGTIDLSDNLLDRLDYAIASLHPPCIKPMSKEENTCALINAIKNPYINIIGHPCDPRYPFDIKKVVSAARDYNTLLEVNNASYNPGNGRAGGEQITLEMLLECKRQGLPVILGSDAHYHSLIGNFSQAEKILQQAEMPDELVINYNPDATLEFLK